MKVYLAGPMTGLTLEEAEKWRRFAASRLVSDYTCFSPLRGKNFLRTRGEMLPDGPAEAYGDQGIFRRDRWDVRRCGVVLAYLAGAKQVSIGTVMELAWAWALGKYVIVVMEKGNPHDHAFVRQAASVVFGTLTEAVQYMNQTLIQSGGGA